MSSTSRVAQGIQSIVTCTVVDGAGNPIDYSATSPALTAEVWPGSTLAVTFSPTAAWNNAALGLVDITFTAANTASVLTGFYQLRIRATDNSLWLWQGDVEIIESPSSTAVTLSPLCTVPYAHAALSRWESSLSDDEWQYLPYALKSSSDTIRKWCNRIFNRQDYVQTLTPQLDGSVKLKEIPVNYVTRVAGQPADAITIICNGTTNQQARVYFSTTGNRDEPGGITITGLNVVGVASGVTTTTNLLWTAYPLLSDLATAINGIGSGWSATVANGFESWPTSELIDGETAQGCMANSGGGVLQINSTDLNTLQTNYETGFVWIQANYSSDAFGPKWGYNWNQWEDSVTTLAPVKVYYNAGFDTIPDSIQSVCVSLAKQFILRFRQNPLFKTETAHQYTYDTTEMVQALSVADQQTLALYRIHNA